jgi:hypothetical protein
MVHSVLLAVSHNGRATALNIKSLSRTKDRGLQSPLLLTIYHLLGLRPGGGRGDYRDSKDE